MHDAFYSRLILVEKACMGVGVETNHWSISTHHLCGLSEFRDGEGHIHLYLLLKRGHGALSRCRRSILSDPYLSEGENIPPICGRQQDLPVQSPVLWPFLSAQGLHEIVWSSLEVGSLERHSSSISGRLASLCRFSAPFTGALLPPLQFCEDLEIIISMEKLDLKPN